MHVKLFIESDIMKSINVVYRSAFMITPDHRDQIVYTSMARLVS